jgi:hypothetical protein
MRPNSYVDELLNVYASYGFGNKSDFINPYFHFTTSRKVAGSNSDEVIGFFN